MRAQATTITVEGVDNIPLHGGALLAVNHISYLDFIYAGTAGYLRGRRLVRFMAKKEIFSVPVAGSMMRAMKHISVDRAAGRGSLEEAVARVRSGQLVGIFPESTISRSFDIRDELKTGSARIAHRAGAPLIPVIMFGQQRQWTKDRPVSMGRTHTPVLIRIGEPIPTTGDAQADTEQLKKTMDAMLDAAVERYIELFGPFAGSPWWLPESHGGSAPTPGQAEELYTTEKRERAEKKADRLERKIERKSMWAIQKLTPAGHSLKGRVVVALKRIKAFLTRS
nr:lysophospholipid acyltransferase family protein [Corynebacterium mendelii]